MCAISGAMTGYLEHWFSVSIYVKVSGSRVLFGGNTNT
jgi:hypothetical protein